MSDNFQHELYVDWMGRGQPFIRLKLDTDQPIELGAFVSAFTALADQYVKFAKERDAGVDPDARLFVKEVRKGSIEADLIPWVAGAVALLPAFVEQANGLAQFVTYYGQGLASYLTSNQQADDTNVSQLRDFDDQVAAIANTPGSSLQVAAIEIVGGKKTTRAVFKFDTKQAQVIRANVERHKRRLERIGDADHKRVLMIFTRTDVGHAQVGKKSGERVKIESITGRSLPVIYASDLAEQQIRHEIAEAEENVYKKGFVVDVNVEMRNDKPIAFRITNLHQVFDLPDE